MRVGTVFLAATALLLGALLFSASQQTTARPLRIVDATERSAVRPVGAPSLAATGMPPSPAPRASLLQPASRIFDLDSLVGIADALAAVAEGDELILYTSDWNGIGWAVNLVQQLAALSLERRALLLADKQRTCVRALATWPWLWCGWSRGIPGFERYASAGTAVTELWTLWSAKWLVLARLVEQRVNVLMTDADMLVLASPYALLRSAPLDRFALVVPPEGARVNVGWLYARGANASGGGLVSLLWDVVRRLRIFLQQVTLRDAQGAPSVAGLWDQVQAAAP